MYTIEDQLKLESDMRGMGVAKFREEMNKAREEGQESRTPAALSLMKIAFDPMKKALDDWFSICETRLDLKKAVPSQAVYNLVKDFNSDTLAFLTLKTVFDNISIKQEYIKICVAIGRAVEDELNLTNFNKQNPSLYGVVDKNLKRRTAHRGHKKTVMKYTARKSGVEFILFSQQQRFIIGAFMLQMFKDTTGFIDIVSAPKRSAKRSPAKLVAPTEKTMEWIRHKNLRCEVMSPFLMPCLIPPKDWTTPDDGGFHTPTMRLGLVKARTREFREDLESVDMWEVYQAVNHLQKTEWVINKKILETLQLVLSADQGLGNLPTSSGKPIPEKPEDISTNPESLREWKKKATEVYNENSRSFSKYIAVQKKAHIANKFKDVDGFYFVYTLDFRGRVYPVQLHLNPQGDDIAKSLLTFKTGSVLDDTAAAWLAVHGANTFGIDKVSLQDRVNWVIENEERIIEVARDPLSRKFWTEADKPWQFLAFCFEWNGFRDNPDNFVSTLPVAMDGSCNGLQNFSAMLRDPIGGKATNLVPDSEPNDVYSYVANELINILNKSSDPLARLWLPFVNRSITKRPTMTMPYGATLMGYKDQIQDEVQSWKDKGLPCPNFEVNNEACMFLAKTIQGALGNVVVAARKAMDWLQEVAKIAASENLPLHWVTPVGFPVLQYYKRIKVTKITTRIMGTLKIQAHIADGYERDMDKRKMSQAIAPNFIHSIDAAHMVRTVNLCETNGINNLQMVHDSFATNASNASNMYDIIRHAFIQIHTEKDPLKEFRDDIIKQLPPDKAALIPPLPEKGELDINLVLDSDYFFA